MILFLGQTMKSFDRAAFAAQPQKMLFQTAFTAFGGAAVTPHAKHSQCFA